MPKSLFAYKYGDVKSGNWTWAIGAKDNISSHPLHIATMNFHGARAAGYDYEELAKTFAKSVDQFEQHAIIFGNPVDGFEVIAPFDSRDDAVEYADRNKLEDNWWILLLQRPAQED